jgi:hypothetical protein
MTGSACTASAETGAGDAVVATAGVMKPRAPDKTVRVTAEAHTALTTYACEAGTDRKTVASELILKNRASPGVNADLPQLIANSCGLAELYLAQLKTELEAGTLKVSVTELERIVNSLVKLNSIREKSSRGAPADPERVKVRCLTREEIKKELNRPYAAPPGDRAEK